MRIRKAEWDDLKQDCYVALLENQRHLDKENAAHQICRTAVRKRWREKQLKTLSLSDPWVAKEAAKLNAVNPEKTKRSEVESLIACCLPEAGNLRTIATLIYLEGRGVPTTAYLLGISRRTVQYRIQEIKDLLIRRETNRGN
jgi:DNA-directed RNA polymerase specialized sigma24 family protein